MIKHISVTTTQRIECINILDQLQRLVEEIKLKDGILLVYVPHTTCAITINEGCDPTVFQDILFKLTDVFPVDDTYVHPEGNSDAHLKAALMGNQRFMFVHDGQIVKGTWESIFLLEFDGPRTRRIFVHYIRTREKE